MPMPLPRQISQRELRNKSGEIMRSLDRGESFVITRNGVPVGSLTPLRDRYFTSAAVAVETARNSPHVDYEQFRNDIDAYVDQDPTPRV